MHGHFFPQGPQNLILCHFTRLNSQLPFPIFICGPLYIFPFLFLSRYCPPNYFIWPILTIWKNKHFMSSQFFTCTDLNLAGSTPLTIGEGRAAVSLHRWEKKTRKETSSFAKIGMNWTEAPLPLIPVSKNGFNPSSSSEFNSLQFFQQFNQKK